jgi:uncharacterized protein (TIGR00369 family)
MTAAPAGEDAPPLRRGHEVGAYFRFERWELPAAGGAEAPSEMVGRVPIDDHHRSPAGGLTTAGLLTCIDSIGGLVAGLSVLPRWIVTTSLSVQVTAPRQVGPLRTHARVLRRGRSSVVAAIDVSDEGAGDARVADAVIACAVLDPGELGLEFTRPLVIPMPAPDPAPEPLETFFAIEDGWGPATRMVLEERLRNPWGILHGGAVATLVDVAARRAVAGDPGGPEGPEGRVGPAAVTGIVLHYLAPIRVGPVEARASVVGRRVDGTVVRVAVHDTGNGDRLAALASVTVGRV